MACVLIKSATIYKDWGAKLHAESMYVLYTRPGPLQTLHSRMTTTESIPKSFK